MLHAGVDLAHSGRRVTFGVTHPLIAMSGEARTDADVGGTADISLPTLRPIAALAGLSLDGRSTLRAVVGVRSGVTSATLDGEVAVPHGQSPLAALIGEHAKLRLSTALAGDGITIERAELEGQDLRLSLAGSDHAGRLEARWNGQCPDLSVLSPALAGQLASSGALRGSWSDIEIEAQVDGALSVHGRPRGPVKLELHAKGLPDHPAGSVVVRGVLDDAPLRLDAAFDRRSNGALHATVTHAGWRSGRLDGDLTLEVGTHAPHGRLELRMDHLADLGPLLGEPLAGSLDAVIALGPSHSRVEVSGTARDVRYGRYRAVSITAVGHRDNVAGAEMIGLRVDAEGVTSGDGAGTVHLTALGPLRHPTLHLDATMRLPAGDAHVVAAATLDATRGTVALSAATAEYRGQSARLLAPAHFHYGAGLEVDRLRVGVGPTVFAVAGRIAPTFDLQASAHRVSPALIGLITSGVPTEGVADGELTLTGSPDAPHGTARLSVEGLRMRAALGRVMPAARMLAAAVMDGEAVRVE